MGPPRAGPQGQGGAASTRRLRGVDLHCAGDPFRLGQVFRNILDNALAAGRPPVAIDVRADAAELEGQPALAYLVRDNGPGLDPNQAESVRPVLHHQGQGDRPGHGHRQAHRRGPRRPDRRRRCTQRSSGAVFVITLPEEHHERSLKIAVADDELDMRDYFQQILPLLGHQVDRRGQGRPRARRTVPQPPDPTW